MRTATPYRKVSPSTIFSYFKVKDKHMGSTGHATRRLHCNADSYLQSVQCLVSPGNSKMEIKEEEGRDKQEEGRNTSALSRFHTQHST